MRAMNYKKIYESIVSRGKARVIKGYKERHHIIPRCMGGGDEEDNLVNLTPEEHYVCHQLLVKMYPTNIKLLYAIQAMSMEGSAGIRSNKMYAWLKRLYNNSRRTGITKQCLNCKKEFYARANRPNKPFCCKKCYHNYNQNEVTCNCCNIKFTRPKSLNTSREKFCSVDCKVKFKSYVFNCCVCNAEVRVPTCRLKQGTPRYCSRKCKGNCR